MSNIPLDIKYEDITLGRLAEFEKQIDEDLILNFAKISGDYNPYHTKEKVAHGMLLGALVSQLIGMYLPGKSAVIVREEMSFRKPVVAPAMVKVKGKVVHMTPAFHLLEIDITIVVNEDIAAEGKVHVKMR